MFGWWLGSILFIIVWVAIAFWPARVAARKGHSFLGYFIFSLIFFPAALIVAYVVQDRTVTPEGRPQAAPLPDRGFARRWVGALHLSWVKSFVGTRLKPSSMGLRVNAALAWSGTHEVSGGGAYESRWETRNPRAGAG